MPILSFLLKESKAIPAPTTDGWCRGCWRLSQVRSGSAGELVVIFAQDDVSDDGQIKAFPPWSAGFIEACPVPVIPLCLIAPIRGVLAWLGNAHPEIFSFSGRCDGSRSVFGAPVEGRPITVERLRQAL